MGADGHITIYFLDPLYKKYGKEKADKFVEVVSDSMTYVHTFKTPLDQRYKVLTQYNGDNIWSSTTIERIFNYKYKNQYMDELTNYDLDWFKENGFTPDELLQMCEFLNQHRMDSWEVWT